MDVYGPAVERALGGRWAGIPGFAVPVPSSGESRGYLCVVGSNPLYAGIENYACRPTTDRRGRPLTPEETVRALVALAAALAATGALVDEAPPGEPPVCPVPRIGPVVASICRSS